MQIDLNKRQAMRPLKISASDGKRKARAKYWDWTATNNFKVTIAYSKLCESIDLYFRNSFLELVFVGPESDHWECLSLTQSLTAV